MLCGQFSDAMDNHHFQKAGKNANEIDEWEHLNKTKLKSKSK